MPADLNYKKKYLELRTKYIADLDTAFRLGFEQGQQASQQQQALDAQAQANQMEQQPGDESGMEEVQESGDEQEGSELDQHIKKLESMLGSSDENPEVKKSLEAIVSLRKEEKLATQLKKSEKTIKGISKALHKPSFKMSSQAQHNMSDNSKKALSLQHKIVSDVMKAWKEEETKASHDIKNILDVENLVKE